VPQMQKKQEKKDKKMAFLLQSAIPSYLSKMT
jgi:hypothetical protein